MWNVLITVMGHTSALFHALGLPLTKRMSTSPTDAARVHATFKTHIGSTSSHNFPLNEKITWLKYENMMGTLDILEHFVLLRE